MPWTRSIVLTTFRGAIHQCSRRQRGADIHRSRGPAASDSLSRSISEHRSLSDADLGAIAGLEQRVVAADGGRLKLGWSTLRERSGEQVDDLLWWEDGHLLGFLGLYPFGGPLELAGMVDPQARRRGIGSALLRRALELAAERGAAQVLLVVARTTPAGDAFARSLGGVPEHSEHALVLRAAPSRGPGLAGVLVRAARREDLPRLSTILVEAFGNDFPVPLSDDPARRRLAVELDGDLVGTLRIDVDQDITTHAAVAGIYGFAVDPARQGRGIGREVLRQVCSGLLEEGCSEVGLEVAVGNEHALGLYTSVGFERRATEDYYALETGALETGPSTPGQPGSSGSGRLASPR